MINNSMLFTAFLSQSINTAACVSHAEPVVMNWNDMSGIGDLKALRYRFMAHGSSVPISWGKLPDKIDR
jgi:hypothetical protein